MRSTHPLACAVPGLRIVDELAYLIEVGAIGVNEETGTDRLGDTAGATADGGYTARGGFQQAQAQAFSS